MKTALVVLHRSVFVSAAVVFAVYNVWTLAHGADGRNAYVFFFWSFVCASLAALPVGRSRRLNRSERVLRDAHIARAMGEWSAAKRQQRAALTAVAYLATAAVVGTAIVMIATLLSDGVLAAG